MKRQVIGILTAALLAVSLAGCSVKTASDTQTADASAVLEQSSSDEDVLSEDTESVDAEQTECPLEDGVYTAEFTTDSSMFHVNEANGDLGVLTVEKGEMTIHVSLVSENIVNLYYGIAEDAQKDGAVLLEPTVDTVTYNDGMTEEVYGFDIPVPYLDEEFDVALVGTKGTWYDHKVSVSNPVPAEE